MEGYDASPSQTGGDYLSPLQPMPTKESLHRPSHTLRAVSNGSNSSSSSSGSGTLSSRSLPRTRLRMVERREQNGNSSGTSPSMESNSPSMEPMEEGWEEKQSEATYTTQDLIQLQPQFLDIRWRLFPDIPRSVRMITHGINNARYMTDVMAMFRRRLSKGKRYNPDKKPTTKKKEMEKKLRGVLNKMTPEMYDRITKRTMDLVGEYGATETEMNDIIG